jgi:RNA polymerase sigma-70 factor (ECF subfamily)
VDVAEPGDVERAFRDFVSERSGSLLRTAYLLAGDWATAEDLLQISLTKTYLAWRRLDRIDAVEAYTRRVLVNTATSWWRRRWHRERPVAVLPDRQVPDSSGAYSDRDVLLRHLRDLPARQRAVIVLRFYEDRSEAETARILGVSVGTVKSQSSRGLATLRTRMTGAADPPAASAPTAGAGPPADDAGPGGADPVPAPRTSAPHGADAAAARRRADASGTPPARTPRQRTRDSGPRLAPARRDGSATAPRLATPGQPQGRAPEERIDGA